MTRIVFVAFSGRRESMELQRPFIDRMLDQHPEAEYHLWDLTRTPEDADYLRSRASERVIVLDHLHPGHPIPCRQPQRRRGCPCMVHKPPFEAPYRWYAERDEYADAVFVKLDDDVVFLETDRLGDLLAPLEAHPNAVVSANVVNNVVAAKHDPALASLVAKRFKVGPVDDPASDRAWWKLHTDPDFARVSHEWFLSNWRTLTADRKPQHTRSRPGEAISINCIAFTHPTMRRLANMLDREGRLGDEGAVDRLLPRIATTFRVAHLTFGPQDKAMSLAELDDLRARYAAAGKEYLES